jgi:hypothetical protein
VAFVRRSGSSTAPIVVDERVITMRARTTAVPFQFGDSRGFFVRARPDHVEVLEPDGRHLSVRVHDVTENACYAIAFAAFALAIAGRVYRRHTQNVDHVERVAR